ncbi:MAG: hypothetical protein ACRD9R_00885 [Pyrinomonadaceae bacterium]
MLWDFELAGRRVRLWQRPGESYAHVLMKGLGYAMYVAAFPEFEIEQAVGLRYKPDLVARSRAESGPRFRFWGECGQTAVRKAHWLLKHAGTEQLVLFKLAINATALAAELRSAVEPRHRQPGRLSIINFREDIVALTSSRRLAVVPQSWYTRIEV